MSDITSDVFALNFDSASSPAIRLRLPPKSYGSHPLGWGYGWYPNDNPAAIIAKDSTATNTEIQMNALKGGTSFRSTVFFCKVKGSATGYTHHETQPFSRSYAGRDWLFIHNGDLDRKALSEMTHHHSRFLEPVGKTDSEMAFCFLLNHLQQAEARKISDVPPETLLAWFAQLDLLGSADFFFSDGITLACFSGSHSERPLSYCRITPPADFPPMAYESASIGLDDPRDQVRTALIFSSAKLDAGSWTPMRPGQLVLARRGIIVWNSDASYEGFTHDAQPSLPMGVPLPDAAQDPIDAPANHRVLNLRSITSTPDGRPMSYRIFDIAHITEYMYSDPVEHSTHNFRLQPVEDAVQEVMTSSVTISSPGEETRFDDVFGNQTVHYAIRQPYIKLLIESVSRVKIYAAPPDDHSLSQRRSSIPLIWMPWQRQMMMPYLLPMELPETQLKALTDYAMSFVERNDFHLMETLKDINRTIHRDYQYRPGTTSLNTTPFELFLSRTGVCQDFANLFICLAQLLSVPARYRVGYIYTGSDYANKIQSDASHAWVELYLPYLGWRGFDPTNGCLVGQDHVRVACGRNFRDATPTGGTIFRGGGIETLYVSVKMNELLV